MLISPAWAQGAGGGAGGLGGIEGFLPLILIFVVFYFLLIRPQQKKAKEHREMIANVRRGDRVVTNGGLIGTVSRVPNDNELQLEIADGIKVRVMRSMIADSLSKTEPAPAKGGKGKADKSDGGDKAEAASDADDADDAAGAEEEKKS